jgi:hypothetical protein
MAEETGKHILTNYPDLSPLNTPIVLSHLQTSASSPTRMAVAARTTDLSTPFEVMKSAILDIR